MKKEAFFRIIIANYNSSDWIKKCLESIMKQTFTDWRVVLVDDLSTDNSFEEAKEYCKGDYRFIFVPAPKKSWNGGARNIGLDYATNTEYTLFMDDDDWFHDDYTLEEVHKTAMSNRMPDCIRLPFSTYLNGTMFDSMLTENNAKDLTNTVYVAPWTKLVKSDLTVPFPENTLVEDVVHHIAQCDNIETVGVHDRPVIVWNRDNPNSTSLEQNKHRYNNKRISSIYRNVADLMDLKCKHDYCEEYRKWRVDCYVDVVRKGIDYHC